jgi:hypothetical protein
LFSRLFNHVAGGPTLWVDRMDSSSDFFRRERFASVVR